MAFQVISKMSAFRCVGGEPVTLLFQNAHSDGTVRPMTGLAFVLAIYSGENELGYFDATIETDQEGDHSLWHTSGNFTANDLGPGTYRWEMAQRINDGRDAFASGPFTVEQGAPRIDDYDAGPPALYVWRIKRKYEAATYFNPDWEVEMVEYAAGAPALQTLQLSNTVATAGEPFASNIIGKTAGSTLAVTANDGTVLTLSGTVLTGQFTTTGDKTITIIETLPASSNSPKTSAIGISAVAATPSPSMDFGFASNSGYVALLPFAVGAPTGSTASSLSFDNPDNSIFLALI